VRPVPCRTEHSVLVYLTWIELCLGVEPQIQAHCPAQHKTDVYLSERCQLNCEAIRLVAKAIGKANCVQPHPIGWENIRKCFLI